MSYSAIQDMLGNEAGTLLDHKCTTIDKSMIHLPGDDFVEFVYNEDADNPFVPQFTDESPPTPGLPRTGRNVGGFIISFGLMLMGLGAFILRRAY